jgi:hypothetical protein
MIGNEPRVSSLDHDHDHDHDHDYDYDYDTTTDLRVPVIEAGEWW